jgi:hypothetical protein
MPVFKIHTAKLRILIFDDCFIVGGKHRELRLKIIKMMFETSSVFIYDVNFGLVIPVNLFVFTNHICFYLPTNVMWLTPQIGGKFIGRVYQRYVANATNWVGQN